MVRVYLSKLPKTHMGVILTNRDRGGALYGNMCVICLLISFHHIVCLFPAHHIYDIRVPVKFVNSLRNYIERAIICELKY